MPSMSNRPCPWCGMRIEIVSRNCGILRCGVYETVSGAWRQIPKHASRETVRDILVHHRVYGCGYPIAVDEKTGVLTRTTWGE